MPTSLVALCVYMHILQIALMWVFLSSSRGDVERFVVHAEFFGLPFPFVFISINVLWSVLFVLDALAAAKQKTPLRTVRVATAIASLSVSLYLVYGTHSVIDTFVALAAE